jgi:hypothetical protein
MGSNLIIMSTTSVDSDTPIYEIWDNDLQVCEIGITNNKIAVNFFEGIGSYEIELDKLLVVMKTVWNKLNDYQNR